MLERKKHCVLFFIEKIIGTFILEKVLPPILRIALFRGVNFGGRYLQLAECG